MPSAATRVSPEEYLNPIILIEVLSKSTAKYDRGEKFDSYRKIRA
jgi:Uma2 family endonuclease